MIVAAEPLAPEQPAGAYYLQALSPVFLHPAVLRLGEARRRALLVQLLYTYLSFTVHLERGPVADALRTIEHGTPLRSLPDVVRREAGRIGEEELSHGAMYERLIESVAEATGVAPAAGPAPAFLGRLRAITERAGAELRPWVGLFFVIVGETLITGDLRRLRRDARVVPAVREVVAAHARDEAGHHVFFSELCAALWPRLAPEVRRPLGLLLPELIGAYLAPDEAAIASALALHSEVLPDPGRVAAEVIALTGALDERARAAAPSVGAFRRCGILDDPRVARAFADAGWARRAQAA